MSCRLAIHSLSAVVIFTIPAFSFSVPQLFWPQKDIDSSSVNQPVLAKKILIASRDSDYKRALVEKIKEGLKDDSVYIKCAGLTKLKNEDASAYRAIVLISTCMAWDWDMAVNAFLKGKTDAANVIIITTSGNGKWMPRKKPAGVDAVAAASEKAGIDAMAADIIKKLKLLLEQK